MIPGNVNCYISYFSVSPAALCFNIFVYEQWNRCSCDNNVVLKRMNLVIDTRGATQNHCWGEKGAGEDKPQSSASENLLFITKGRRGNTIRGMFSFGQLCEWMLRFGVTHTDIRCVCSQFPHPKPASTPPGKYNFLPHSSRCDFVLFLRSCFTNSFVKAHKGLLRPVKPSLGKQWKVSFFIHRDYRITKTVRRRGYCVEANGSRPQPQRNTEVSVSESKSVYVGNSQT